MRSGVSKASHISTDSVQFPKEAFWQRFIWRRTEKSKAKKKAWKILHGLCRESAYYDSTAAPEVLHRMQREPITAHHSSACMTCPPIAILYYRTYPPTDILQLRSSTDADIHQTAANSFHCSRAGPSEPMTAVPVRPPKSKTGEAQQRYIRHVQLFAPNLIRPDFVPHFGLWLYY